MTRGPSPSESARLLRQRVEMGATDLVLEGMTREEALAMVRAARRELEETPAAARDAATAPATGRDEAAAPATRPDRDAQREGNRAYAEPPSPRAAAVPAGPPRRERGSSGPTSSGPVALPILPDDYEALRELALGCTACGLSESRTQVVFSDGPKDASLMVVGEAPGANEDETGLPFVGAAGKYLDLLLATVDLSREESVYIANVLKCRPPGNRNPTDLEIETCSPYLRKQIDLVRPRALLAVGSFSGKLLTGEARASLGSLRGTVHSYHGVPLVVTYHPAALLRNPRWTRLFWDDLQLLRGVLDAG